MGSIDHQQAVGCCCELIENSKELIAIKERKSGDGSQLDQTNVTAMCTNLVDL